MKAQFDPHSENGLSVAQPRPAIIFSFLVTIRLTFKGGGQVFFSLFHSSSACFRFGPEPNGPRTFLLVFLPRVKLHYFSDRRSSIAFMVLPFPARIGEPFLLPFFLSVIVPFVFSSSISPVYLPGNKCPLALTRSCYPLSLVVDPKGQRRREKTNDAHLSSYRFLPLLRR